MKKFVEGVKDFFYDAIDYILIVFIIIAVIGVIGWRLDILFAKSPINNIKESNNIISDTNNPQDNNNNTNEEEPENETIDEQKKPENEDNKNNENAQPDSTPEETPEEIINIVIPKGSLATNIAKILFDKGLINDKNQFLIKAQELGLDTKLKSGTFQIKSNSSLETIIKIIAN